MQAPAFRVRQAAIQGFTLIELMVAVAILGIIVAVAFPSFKSAIVKGRRADAFAAIAAIQQAQERWRANQSTYSTSLASTALNVAQPDRYEITVSEPGGSSTLANGYIVTAIGRNGQDGDNQCRKLSLKLTDGNLSYAGCFDCVTFTYASSHTCWSR